MKMATSWRRTTTVTRIVLEDIASFTHGPFVWHLRFSRIIRGQLNIGFRSTVDLVFSEYFKEYFYEDTGSGHIQGTW